MQTQAIEITAHDAYKLYQEYQRSRHFETKVDAEIRRAYREISKGKTVIKALESIVAAGVHADGTPKLAIVRADQPRCLFSRNFNGSFEMAAPNHLRHTRAAADRRFVFREGSLPPQKDIDRDGKPTVWWRDRQAMAPIVPIFLRPRHSLSNYHILWEAEWSPIVPKDPLLLRRIGLSDLWVVLAAWDLTEVERAALATRVSFN